MESLIKLAQLLEGSPIYESSDVKQPLRKALDALVESGEVIEHRSGSQRWWQVSQNTLTFIRRQRAA